MNQKTPIPHREGVHVGLPVRPAIGTPGKKQRPSGMIVVRLTPEASHFDRDKLADTLREHAKMYALKGLSHILEGSGEPESHRMVRSVRPDKLSEMERSAIHSKFAPLHSLSQYWRLDLRDRPSEEVARLVALLSALPEVEAAWEEPLTTPPVVTPADDPHNVTQDYQDAAPTGIDARWVWTQPNGEGAGIGVVDVEGGWRITHEDLTGKNPTLIHGSQYSSWEDHGTAVLGEILATDNTVGIVGTAPAITSVRMSSIFDSAGLPHVTDALVAAIAAMSVGEILLIELQTDFLPEETLDDRLDAIRLATAKGILVVEAGGNGHTDLDAWTTSTGLHRLNRNSPDFVDSGAIMVGASVSALSTDNQSHERWWHSNYGSRIDCYAWGENVTSSGYGDLDNGGGNADKYYTDTFQGTSSASPIIVGAAALVQSNYHTVTGTYLSPTQMRTLLSDPTRGTPQGAGVAGAIGVMPNLNLIMPALGLVADVYMRDAIGDNGAVPWTGAISASPDVIVRPSSVPDPQVAYGEGSGTEDSITLGYEVDSSKDNFIYVRVRNRGGAAAANVVATVYWSEVATLVTPTSWHLIGTVTIPSVPVGDVLTVSPELKWLEAAIPGTGHYCFVATLQCPGDPVPPTPGSLDWSSFQDMIRANNNVTWRNFNVIKPPDTPDATTSFVFKVTGADDIALPFAFEIERRLPPDAIVHLEGPLGLLVRLRGERPWKLVEGKNHESAQLTLPSQPRVMLEEVRIPRGVRFLCKFTIRAGRHKVAFGNGLAIRQLYQGKEVGRIHWHFAPEARLHSEMKKQ